MDKELKKLKRTARKNGKAMRIVVWIMLVLFSFLFITGYAFLRIDQDTASDSSRLKAYFLLASGP